MFVKDCKEGACEEGVKRTFGIGRAEITLGYSDILFLLENEKALRSWYDVNVLN